MANLQEHSSSMSYTSPSCITDDDPESTCTLEAFSLNKLSSNLGILLLDEEPFNFNDAEIEVEGSIIRIHRCILATRSSFFYKLFSEEGSASSVKPRYHMKDHLPFGHVGRDVFLEFLRYLYTGKLRQSDPDVSTCMDGDCTHEACRPAIDFSVEMMYASFCFKITELVSLLQRRLFDFVDKAFAEELIPILLVAFHTEQNQLLEHCANKVAHSNLDETLLIKKLPTELVDKIKSIHRGLRSSAVESVDIPAKIHKALDSHDVELAKMLLQESNITLDDTNALHYAVAYCDYKIVADVLELGADVNIRNTRGYTPLHMAAMRMEPAIIMELVSKGASVSATTNDGQNAVSICRRLTRPKDYNASRQRCKESNKRRLCIDILEQELQRPVVLGEHVEPLSSPENLQMQANDLENRVDIAKLVFPAEAKLAMKIAETETKKLDLNETHTQQLQTRINRLKRTVELGRRYFPHCSEWLDNFIGDDHVSGLCNFEGGQNNQQEFKRMRFNEIKKDLLEAFNRDMARKDERSTKGPPKHSSSFLAASSAKESRRYNKILRK